MVIINKFFNNNKGQVVLAGMFFFLIAVVFMAFAFNVGIMVMARAQLQNAADAAALSGAVVQAEAMTKMLHINQEIVELIQKANKESFLDAPIFETYEDGVSFVKSQHYDERIKLLTNKLKLINNQTPNKVLEVAHQVAFENLRGINPFPSSNAIQIFLPGKNSQKLMTLKQEKNNINFAYEGTVLGKVGRLEIDGHYKRENDFITYCAVGLESSPLSSNMLLGVDFFNINPNPLRAFACAKPWKGYMDGNPVVPKVMVYPRWGVLGVAKFTRPWWLNITDDITCDQYEAWLVSISDNNLKPKPTQINFYWNYLH